MKFNRIPLQLTLVMLCLGCVKNVSQKNTQDTITMKQTSDAYASSFNAHDANKIAQLFSDDGRYVNFTTRETVVGKDAIQQYFQDLFTQDNSVKLNVTIDTITHKNAQNMVEQGFAELTWSGNNKEKYAFRADYVNENNSWLLNKLSQVIVGSPRSHYEQLKELSWLSGKWKDADTEDEMDVNLLYKWEMNNNFFVQDFTKTILGQKEVQGLQIIGWDPVQKQIRSWIFDSDGGYGESTWFKDGNSWYSVMKYTLENGKVASSTNVYTKIDEDTYNYSIESRDVDGRVLPNIGPFKIIRDKGAKE